MRILITGGAGYKGSLLVEELLKLGHSVEVLDNFIYGFEPLLGFSRNRNFTVNRKDIRNITQEDVNGFDVVYHLAAISGYPACEANPHSAQAINVDSTKKLVSFLDPKQTLVYASTTSLYGRTSEPIDESYVPTPVSLYGITKFEAEKICLEHERTVVYRFATLFGSSHKMRCDLLLNDFVLRAVTERSLILFDGESIRTFLHVDDAVKSYLMVLEHAEEMMGEVFNVGSDTMNYSKLDLAESIKSELEGILVVNSELIDPDKRNFIINFDKIKKLGYKPTLSLKEGIQDLVRFYSWYRPHKVFQTI